MSGGTSSGAVAPVAGAGLSSITSEEKTCTTTEPNVTFFPCILYDNGFFGGDKMPFSGWLSAEFRAGGSCPG